MKFLSFHLGFGWLMVKHSVMMHMHIDDAYAHRSLLQKGDLIKIVLLIVTALRCK